MSRSGIPVSQLGDLKSALDRDGYCVVPSIISEDILTEAQKELNRLVDAVAHEQMDAKLTDSLHADQPFEKRIAKIYEGRLNEAPKDWRPELHLPGLFPLFFNNSLLDIAEHVLDTKEIRLYPNYTCRPKVPGGTERHTVLWHQDAGYTQSTTWHAPKQYTAKELNDALTCMMNVWIPMVDATEENGCMQFIPASHRLGIQKHIERQEYLELDPAIMEKCVDQAVSIEAKRGDVVLFGQYLYHCGLPNVSDGVRWTFDFRYQDASASTLRNEPGHLARSVENAEKVVRDGKHWSQLDLGGPNPRKSTIVLPKDTGSE